MSSIDYSPFSYAFHEDPYPTYRRMRDEEPLYRNDEFGFWALSRFEDIWHATGSDSFTAELGVTPEMVLSVVLYRGESPSKGGRIPGNPSSIPGPPAFARPFARPFADFRTLISQTVHSPNLHNLKCQRGRPCRRPS
mgnify:CR=1 FL=1